MNTQLRKVVAGQYCPARQSTVYADPSFGDRDELEEWRQRIADEIDAQPHEQDICAPATLGKMDAEENIYCPPRSNRADFDKYIVAWNTEWARFNKRNLVR